MPPSSTRLPGLDISVVVCTRNRAERLAKALNRWAALAPKSSWELVLVDNGSTDATPEVLAEAQKRLPALRRAMEPRRGLGAARDHGWREARGAIIAFTDDDCYPSPDYVDQYVEAFRRSPDVGYMGGRILLWDESDARITVDYRDEAEEIAPYRFIPAGELHGANFAFRREALERVGGLDPELGAGTAFFAGEDIDLVAAAAWAGFKGRFDPAPLVYHHHGRKAGDFDITTRGYDVGRGVYYAKFILRKDSRSIYLRAWLRSIVDCAKQAIRQRNKRELLGPALELYGAARYLVRARPPRSVASD
jgi:glycosyltransferase involved in cell wall biosynthesis